MSTASAFVACIHNETNAEKEANAKRHAFSVLREFLFALAVWCSASSYPFSARMTEFRLLVDEVVARTEKHLLTPAVGDAHRRNVKVK